MEQNLASFRNRNPQVVFQLQEETILATDDFPGDFNFRLVPFGDGKNSIYTYSSVLNKLFVNFAKDIPIAFSVDLPSSAPPLYIRALLVFTDANEAQNIPVRCRNHRNPNEDHNQGFPPDYIHHLIRIVNSQGVTYHDDPVSTRTSVRVRLGVPIEGEHLFTFHFVCKHACVGGLNRRETRTVYLLEDEIGQVYGRVSLKLRMCACPGRDRDFGEKKFQRNLQRELEEERQRQHHQQEQQNNNRNMQNSSKKSMIRVTERVPDVPQPTDRHTVILNAPNTETAELFETCIEAIDIVESLKADHPDVYNAIQNKRKEGGFFVSDR